MLTVLGETQPRVEHDSRARDVRPERKLRARREIARHFADYVAIACEFDMVGGTAPHMHQHHRAFRSRGELRHLGIVLERGNVVDYRGAGIECETGDRRAPGIDRKRNAEPLPKSREDWSYAFQLHFDWDFTRADR